MLGHTPTSDEFVNNLMAYDTLRRFRIHYALTHFVSNPNLVGLSLRTPNHQHAAHEFLIAATTVARSAGQNLDYAAEFERRMTPAPLLESVTQP
jgi:hypothetical protein